MPTNVTKHDAVVIGGSAGALEALKCIVSVLPKDLQAAVFVVLHVSSEARSVLPNILKSASSIDAEHPRDGQAIERGKIYVAKPDFHMLIEDGKIRMSRGPRENRHRPAIDPLFRTAARAFGPRLIGVILSGSLDDGAAGLAAVKLRGGLAIVQDPKDALVCQMPQKAMEHVRPDYVLPASEIGNLLGRLTSGQTLTSKGETDPMEGKQNRKRDKNALDVTDLRRRAEGALNGKPSQFACPECHGVLWEEKEGELVKYRCRVGHAYTESALAGEMSQATEAALWASLRALSEQSSLLKRMAQRTGPQLAARYRDQATGYDEHCATIRKILLNDAQVEEAAS